MSHEINFSGGNGDKGNFDFPSPRTDKATIWLIHTLLYMYVMEYIQHTKYTHCVTVTPKTCADIKHNIITREVSRAAMYRY